MIAATLSMIYVGKQKLKPALIYGLKTMIVTGLALIALTMLSLPVLLVSWLVGAFGYANLAVQALGYIVTFAVAYYYARKTVGKKKNLARNVAAATILVSFALSYFLAFSSGALLSAVFGSVAPEQAAGAMSMVP